MDYRTNIRENLLLALDTLRTHKFRSFLTVLGVLIGVAAVIVMVSIFAGMVSQVSALSKQYGTDNIYIFKFQPGLNFKLTRAMRLRKPITYEQGMAVKADCRDVEDVSVEMVNWNRTPPVFKYKGQQMLNGNLTGATPNDFAINNAGLADGRFFTEADNWHRRKVAVLGADVVTQLFPNVDPIGKTITLDGNNFEIVGTMTKRKEFFIDTGDNRIVYVPYETYHEIYPSAKENFVLAKAYPGKRQAAMDEITGVLRRLRQDKPGAENSFGLATADTFIDQFNSIIGTIAVAMIAVASIGLLVGGIGVMNIMLVSVTERTREIGVRKAIGARRSDINWQFLFEAMTLTGGGGIMGIILGYLLSFAVRLIFTSLETSVPIWAVIVAFVISVGIGLFFGIWPATKAARLDPIVALRYE
ncbi:MAG: ABC transporter permease [Acidobacteriota bacterium]|nr:ABC transporter permease [Acidobacteriota bacterium]